MAEETRRSKYDGLIGIKYGRLTTISQLPNKNGFRYYLCRCSCGREKTIRADGLVSGFVLSCGCLKQEIAEKPKEKCRKTNDYIIQNDIVYVRLSNSDDIMICDKKDWDQLKNHCWEFSSDGYAKTNYHKNDTLMSNKFHINVVGRKDGLVVDHINRNRLDNRRCNLRHVTKQANAVNYNVSKNNTSGVTGVYHRKDYDRWKATIFINGKEIALGHYATKEEAAAAREKGEEKYFSPLFKEIT